VASVILFAGCASIPKAYYNADPNVDFTQYKSYGFLEDLSTDNNNYESMESNFLKVAVAQQRALITAIVPRTTIRGVAMAVTRRALISTPRVR
jgi:hypothetical protein